MKKKQQKKRLQFTLDDGRRVEFDWTRFCDEFENKERKIKCSKDALYCKIVQHLYHLSYDEAKDKTDTVKKWRSGDGSPRNLLEIYKPLAEFFGCEEDAFLKYVDEETKEEHKMNTTAAPRHSVPVNMVFPTTESTMIRAMERMKEKEAASELYGVMVKLIYEYASADESFWCEGSDNPMTKSTSEFPNRNLAEIAIRKSAPYLPKEIRYQASALLDDMFGERSFGWEELKRNEYFARDNYIMLKEKQYEEYVKLDEKDPKALSEDDAYGYWLDMMRDELYELLERLDDIFADYLCD